jgi:hypothetical protein
MSMGVNVSRRKIDRINIVQSEKVNIEIIKNNKRASVIETRKRFTYLSTLYRPVE